MHVTKFKTEGLSIEYVACAKGGGCYLSQDIRLVSMLQNVFFITLSKTNIFNC